MARLDAFFRLMNAQGASDLHLAAGNLPALRIKGDIERIHYHVLEDDELKDLLYEIVNEELRYRHRTGLGAAVFYDGGNVFAKVKDVSFDWLHSVGFGLRWDSPIGLLRLDLGLPLNRRTLPFDAGEPPRQEPAYQVFFSFGQAF